MTGTRKRVAIVFFDSWLPYSPTTLNYYDQLHREFEVAIIHRSSGNPRYAVDLGGRVVIDLRMVATRLTDKIKYMLSRLTDAPRCRCSYADFLESQRLGRALAGFRADHVVAIDTAALRSVQRAWGGTPHLLSLEIKTSLEWQCIDKQRVNAVLVDSKERYKEFLGDVGRKTFVVPNAPAFEAIEKPDTDPRDLLYCGNPLDRFGIYSYLHFLLFYPDYFLTIKGPLHKAFQENAAMFFPQLLQQGRLRLDAEYVEEKCINRYLSRFRIGFCIYDLRFAQQRIAHYKLVNSQKMYRYFASGVPVIANNLPGLKAVRDFQAGVMVAELTPRAIFQAISEIERNYDSYVANCLHAAQQFSFDVSVRPFLQYLADHP